ncbi:hypothetical protein BGY98DRAFT_944832 [Russula aff. rugulosa BPL654]|nr:hypothetical protein BGY98DRAFT_944832 [Russula aff. rugulosa BPL654]
MSSNLSHERSGCFSGLLAGSRRQRGCQSVSMQVESASPLAPQESSHGKSLPGDFPEYVRIASSCDFGSTQGSTQREGSVPPPYSWTTPEKDHIPDVMCTIEDTIRGLDHELRQLSLDIHDHPELNFEERYAHDRLTEFMSSRGFTVTRQYLGLETAWRAEFRHGARGVGRIVGVNAEMDALPGIGHGCGHNLIAMAGVAKHDVPGTVICSALQVPEESGAGKQILLEKGAYKDMDICIMYVSPVAGDTLEIGFVSSLALQTLTVEYFGQPAHAGYAPWEGVNALDAAFVAYAGISALRQQIRPEQRVHGVISGRDWTPNVIPDYAKMSWSVRADAWTALEPLRDRVVSCLESGASATGCRHQVKLGERYLDLHQNTVLADDLALTAQRCYGIPSYWAEQAASASTDFGNVSYEPHTRFRPRRTHRSSHTAALRTATLLARTAFRVHADSAFCARPYCPGPTGAGSSAPAVARLLRRVDAGGGTNSSTGSGDAKLMVRARGAGPSY